MGDDFITNDGNDLWYQYRSIMGVPSRRRIFCGIACITFVLSLIFIAFVFMAVKANASKVTTKTNSECNETMFTNSPTEEFSLKLYKSFPSSLNISVDPCLDFYNFSCGLWAQNNPIPPYDARITTFSVLQDIVKKKKKTIFETKKPSKDLPRVVNYALRFYNACVEHNNSKNSTMYLLNQYFSQIGGWPILNPSKWDESSFDWLHASAFLIKHMDLHTVIGVYCTDDDKSGGRNVIYLKQPSVLDDEEHSLDNMASAQMLYVILEVLGGNSLNSNFSEDFDRLTKVETEWRKLLSPPKKASVPLYTSIKGLSEKIPDIDWLKYLQLITNDTLLELNETLAMNDTVIIDNLDYIHKIVSIMSSNNFSKIELANLFGWFIVKDIWILIPNVLEEYAKLNEYTINDMKKAVDNKCFDLVIETFPSSLDYLYVKNSTYAGNEDERILIKYLKSAFKDIIEKSHWLDIETKTSVLYKLNDMQQVIGFPDYMTNKTEFDKMYPNFPVMTDDILKYYCNILAFYVKRRSLSLRISYGDTDWGLPRSITDASAYYVIYKNTVVYPISLHNPPFYYFNGPWYLNYGAIGSVIGHEIMHAFDNYESLGNELNATWLSKSSKKFYVELAECFKLQYSDFDSTGVYKNNGTSTLRENIADNEGLRVAFNAYKRYTKDFGGEENYRTLNCYSPDQMFYIAYASVWCSEISPSRKAAQKGTHSFPELRVNKVVSNSKSFAVAFGCPEGSPMNPIKKCSIW